MMKRYAACFLLIAAALFLPVLTELGLIAALGCFGISPADFVRQNGELYFCLYQAAWLLGAGLWYYAGFYKKRGAEAEKHRLPVSALPVLALGALSMYFIINGGLFWVQRLLPELAAEYDALMEESKIAALTVLSTVSTLVLAPLVEELVFRGVITGYLRRACVPFAVVNLIQALLFGAYHMNWIQGFYAFLLGLFLGFVRNRYRTIKASVFFHACFNLFGTYLSAALAGLPGTAAGYVIIQLGGLLFLLAALRLMPGTSPARAGNDGIK